MPDKRGVIFQTVPEEVAQAVDFLSQQYQLPTDRIVKAGISMMVAMHSQNDPRFQKFMDMVKADLERSIDRVLI